MFLVVTFVTTFSIKIELPAMEQSIKTKCTLEELLQLFEIQVTTVIVDPVIVESTALVEQKPLTTQFYLLLVESPL